MTDTPAPAVLRVFPLTGSLLLPGSFLPLNVFETRYRNMVADAMAEAAAAGGTEPYIGMIQPFTPQQDNWPALEPPPENPDLYTIGCAGRIDRCEPQPDGRYHIVLRGLCRFRVRSELPLERGYRRVQAEYGEFTRDLDEPAIVLDPGRLLYATRAFGEKHGLDFDFDVLAALPGIALLNGLATALPFTPAEKQALLEAQGPMEREELLLLLMGMGIEPQSAEEYYSPPTLH